MAARPVRVGNWALPILCALRGERYQMRTEMRVVTITFMPNGGQWLQQGPLHPSRPVLQPTGPSELQRPQYTHPLHLIFISPPASQEPMYSMHLTTITILNEITNFMIFLLIHACICPTIFISPLQMGKLAEIARQLPSDQDTSSRNILESVLVSQPCLLQSHHLLRDLLNATDKNRA